MKNHLIWVGLVHSLLLPAEKQTWDKRKQSIWHLYHRELVTLGPVPEWPIRANPGLKYYYFHFLYLIYYALLRVIFCIIITESQSKGAWVACSYILNLGLNLTILGGAQPSPDYWWIIWALPQKVIRCGSTPVSIVLLTLIIFFTIHIF